MKNESGLIDAGIARKYNLFGLRMPLPRFYCLTCGTNQDREAVPPPASRGRKPIAAIRIICNDLQISELTGLGIDPNMLMTLAPIMAKVALDSGSLANVVECEIAAKLLQRGRLPSRIGAEAAR